MLAIECVHSICFNLEMFYYMLNENDNYRKCIVLWWVYFVRKITWLVKLFDQLNSTQAKIDSNKNTKSSLNSNDEFVAQYNWTTSTHLQTNICYK
jgi:hypothetical protein